MFAEGAPGRNRELAPPSAGWLGACQRGGLSAVHLGEGWILTAAHVGVGTVLVADESFAPRPESRVLLTGARDNPDLVMFRVDGTPAGRRLEIATEPLRSGESVLVFGAGGIRGGRLSWLGRQGFYRARSIGLQWGRNRVSKSAHRLRLGSYTTETFGIEFDDFFAVPEEAIAVEGDSGGPVFRHTEDGYELAGIFVATSQYEGQPESTVLFGATSFAADLTVYRERIDQVRGAVKGIRGGAYPLFLLAGLALASATLWVRRALKRSTRSEA